MENQRSECKRFLKNGCLEEKIESKYFVNEFSYRNIVNVNVCHLENKRSQLKFDKIERKKNQNDASDFLSIENYERTPKANYANLDAKYFYEYARKAFGTKGNNIK